MNNEQISLVQESWARVAPLGSQATALFYTRMFEVYPELRDMFPDEMDHQHELLFRMIDTAVKGLDNVSALVPAVQALGVRHAGYGVKDEDYGKVGASLLWTLEQGLGEHWNDETAEAWTAVYGVLASTMQEAAAATAGA